MRPHLALFLTLFLLAPFVHGQSGGSGSGSGSGYSRERACRQAFNECQFRFNGYSNRIPVWDISGDADVPFTTRIISVNKSEIIGIANTNDDPADFIYARAYYPITTAGLKPTHFKSYTKVIDEEAGIFASGVGHQVFHGMQMERAKDKCVRLYFSNYQVLSNETYYVVDNKNYLMEADKKCVVFYTAK